MAVTVVVETGAGISGANSYASIATITEYVLSNPHDATWADLTDAQKNGYAVFSCRVLNEQVMWDGWQSDADQSLDLPRSGMADRNGNSIDSDEIPTEVQDAQCELARLLAVTDRTADSDMAGLKELSVGSIKLVADKSDRPTVLPAAVWAMVSAYGTKRISKGTSRVIRT